MIIFSFIFFVFFVVKAKQKAYFPSRKPWAALGAAATIRDLERVYSETRTYFKLIYGNSTIDPIAPIRDDSSGDIAAAGRQPAAVLPSAMTNVDHSERETEKTGLTADSGVVYQAKTNSDHPEDNGKTGHNPGWFGSPERQTQQTITNLTLTAARQSL